MAVISVRLKEDFMDKSARWTGPYKSHNTRFVLILLRLFQKSDEFWKSNLLLQHLRTVSKKPEQMQSQFQKEPIFEIGSSYEYFRPIQNIHERINAIGINNTTECE